MKAADIIRLNKWIADQKQWIMQTNPTLKDIRAKAQTMLSVRCPEGAIRDCMKENAIPARRSKAEAERQLLIDQITDLNDLIFDLVAHGNMPPSMLLKFKERRTNLNAKVMDCLNRYINRDEAA